MYESKINWCHVCNQGWVCIVKTNDNIYYCLCAECETEWDSPEDCINKIEGTHDKYSSVVNLSYEDLEKWSEILIH